MERQNTGDAQQASQAVPGEQLTSEAYSWPADEHLQQQYQYQLYEGGQPQQVEPSHPAQSQMADGETRREMAQERQQQQQQPQQQPQQQQKIEVDEQQLANALLETLQKLTRPQPAATGAIAAIAPPPPPPPPPSETYYARTPSTLVVPRTPRTPVAGRQMRYLSTISNGNGFKGPTVTQAFIPTEGLQYATGPHTRTYSEKSFATR